jgi:hypothetical protein
VASAAPSRANKDDGFSPRGIRRFPLASVYET